MKKQMKKWVIAAAMAVCLMMFAGVASAHVTVQPPSVPANSYQVFAVRVPSEEKGVNTVKVQVKVADGAVISRVEPKPGWTSELEKDANGVVTSITWTAAEGGGLSETEFTEFRMSGKVNEDATKLVWKAYQTYSDNKVVEWVGADGSDKPASVTTVTAAVAEGDGHGHDAGAAADASDAKDSDSKLPLTLSIIALALGASAFVMAARKNKK
ncbi:YcnI family copper-binding membrane protein [Paenibacillus sp. MMO-177]|uniref:YcnI family copper-binding membrane protein n=1 Tax=Paenibacillus sp. MMO-177 TaxID=3081289 RepID=UPI003017B23A